VIGLYVLATHRGSIRGRKAHHQGK